MTTATANTFNEKAKSKFFRFENNNDLVTTDIPLIGYSHVGTHVYITEGKELHKDPSLWLLFRDAIHGIVNYVGQIIDIFGDHNMNKYLSAVRNWDSSFNFK